MNILSKAEFYARKKHDGICICGTGYSINDISHDTWNTINSQYDTFGMNWYCKSKRHTTWYLVREQCASKKRIESEHELIDFIELMKSFEYSCKIVKDMTKHATNYHHCLNLDKFDGDGMVFLEPDSGCGAKSFRESIFDFGIHHGKGTIYDALHFAIAMEYQKILFCGIDLYDNRYFYLPWDKTLGQVEKEGRDNNSRHLMADKTIKIIKEANDFWEIPMFVQNKKSLLTEIIPVWEGE